MSSRFVGGGGVEGDGDGERDGNVYSRVNKDNNGINRDW